MKKLLEDTEPLQPYRIFKASEENALKADLLEVKDLGGIPAESKLIIRAALLGKSQGKPAFKVF